MILVYGGAFNPPTKAHQEIVRELYHTFKPLKMIILPVGVTYDHKRNLVSFEHRYQMINLMIKDLPFKVEISRIEEEGPFLGTYHSLNELSKTNEDLYFVVGTDHLSTLGTWKNHKELLKKYGFVVILRKNYAADFTIFDQYQTPYYTFKYDSLIASSKIRQEIHKYKHDLTPEIYDYIIENNLY